MTVRTSPVVTEVAGYCDDVSFRPGGTISVHASGSGAARVGLARLRAVVKDGKADWTADPVAGIGPVTVDLVPQEVSAGSYAVVDAPWEPDEAGALQVTLWFRATGATESGTIAAWSWQGVGYELRFSLGRLHLDVGGRSVVDVGLGESSAWQRIAVEVDDRAGWVQLERGEEAAREQVAATSDQGASSSRLVIGTDLDLSRGLLDGVVAGLECHAREGAENRILGAWDFGVGRRDAALLDISGNGRHGRLEQLPVRGVPGPQWSRTEVDPRLAPEEFDATHFHTDDLSDVQWPNSVTLVVPEDLESGIYAVTIDTGSARDHIPVVIRARPQKRGRVAFLLSTFTYLAYANANLGDRIDYVEAGISGRPYLPGARDLQVQRNPEVAGSLYDVHRDGSGRCFSSLRRPIFTYRADFVSAVQQAPRHLGADLLIWEWLLRQPFAVDVITDHDLHREGAAALDGYDVVVTSSHPEYVSRQILDALEWHLEQDNGLMYLGGNGFYWVTSAVDDAASVIECRRGNAGTRTWDSPAGEAHHSSTGELGGLWRHRGRSPNALVGIGMASQGWDERAQAFATAPACLDESAGLGWMFARMRDAARFGDDGLVMGGASGDELDRYDVDLGSPTGAIVVATSERHSAHYMLVHEDLLMSEVRLGADVNDKVRSDVVWNETTAGATFAAGSITWAGALGHNDFDNDVAILTANVLGYLVDRRRREV